MVPKGSIAVDGISLTLVDVSRPWFSVMLIPHTLAVTTLGSSTLRRPRQHRDRHAGQARAKTDWSGDPFQISIMPPIRQTQSYLRGLFARRGISPQRRLGQNFLIDLNIHDLIVKAAEVSAGDVVLEVGSGAGALTTLLAARGATVMAVDVDPAMARLTAEAVAGLAERAGAHLRCPGRQAHDRPDGRSTACVQALAAEARTPVQARRKPALSCGDSAHHQPAGPSRAVPGAAGGHDSAGNGRSAVRSAGEPGLWGGLGPGAGAGRCVDRQGAAALGLLAAAQGRFGGDRHPAEP